MKCVLIEVSGGIIDEVKFFSDYKEAIDSLCHYARTMDPERQDAGVYSARGMLANAKEFLDDIVDRIDT
jgi:hypothetical protein